MREWESEREIETETGNHKYQKDRQRAWAGGREDKGGERESIERER